MTTDQKNSTSKNHFKFTQSDWSVIWARIHGIVKYWILGALVGISDEEADGNVKLMEAAPKFYRTAKEIVSGFNDRGGKRMTIYDTAIKEGLEKIINEIES